MLHARKSYNERIQDKAGIIPEAEPVFLIRGQDLLAPAILDIYVAMSRNLKSHDSNLTHAIAQLACEMRIWQKENPTKAKTADMPDDDSIY